ncbi:hypothetical protein LXL04_001074 [Taraxacum kok-saghyz]
MAANNQHILGLATSSSFQIPSINIKLETSNFCLWRTTIISALETFDLESFILNPQPPPETITTEREDAAPIIVPNPEYQLWKKRDRYVLLWLKSTLAERALAIAQTRATRMAMKHQLQTLSKGSMSMIDYNEKKRTIADSLAENLNPISTEDQIGYILQGLDSSYGPFISAVMLKDDIASVDDLVGLLFHEEARIEHDHLRNSVLVADSTGAPPTTLTVNRQSRFPSQSSGSSNSSPSGNRTSDTRRRRHEAINYWQRSNLVDYPSRKPNPRDPPARQAHLSQYQNPSAMVDPSWYVDSGATDHIAPYLQRMNLAEEYQGTDKLQVGNGTNLHISHIASTSLHNLKLPYVLIVPHITKRLVSASKLSRDNNVYLELWPNRCVVKSLQGRILLSGDVHDGLYRLPSSSNTPHNSSSPDVALVGIRTSLHGWHNRLAHLHASLLRHLVSSFNLPLSSNKFPNVCDACQLGKSHRFPLPVSHVPVRFSWIL